jgi:hypothetical protein
VPDNIRVKFTDGSAMVYEPTSAVRIANRGPSRTRYKDFEKVGDHPPEWVGFGTFEARILAVGHRVQTHRRLMTVASVERGVDEPAGDPAVLN